MEAALHRWSVANAVACVIGIAISAVFGEARLLAVLGAGSLAVAAWRFASPRRPADAITITRGALILCAALAAEPAPRSAAAILAIAAALDLCDGAVARRLRQTSAEGAVLDVETDAYFVATSSLTAVMLGRVGLWLLMPSMLRAALVVLRAFRPAPERRGWSGRIAFAALSIGLIAVCASDGVGARGVAAAGTAAVCATFAIDYWLVLRH